MEGLEGLEGLGALGLVVTWAVFLTEAHFSPKRSACIVSPECFASMEPVTITAVLESPPRAPERSIVSLLSW